MDYEANDGLQQGGQDEQGGEYSPGRLLDTLAAKLNARNDAALARAIEVAPAIVSKIRHGRLPVGASILLRMHEASGIGIRELRDLMGDRRGRHRMSPTEFRPGGQPPAPQAHQPRQASGTSNEG
ncbi:helix-turn-helix domain-containing protein [Pseudoduganella plicata]|uniref:Uncharacterized protein n=1 Tax=Pseudoduganella plicata TaxID=321984 RepID=A0AA87Y3M1_9BURK|nr:helix-turn-helix domain-containing protein [Pseudoduganella plicata]GGY89644.1 hypothetical protein GCM10007388_23960 [Pseudoduganella plicata]